MIVTFCGHRDFVESTDIEERLAALIEKYARESDRLIFYNGGYGNYIKIRHANGLETCYSHNSKNLVKKGDVVKAGQVIALTGRTGRASTEHLHFECRVNGQTFDPAKIFDHANQAVKMDRLTFTKRGRSVSIKAEKNYMAKGK